MNAAMPFLSEDFNFNASFTWVERFKRKHRIRQRKITKFVSSKEFATMEEVLAAAEEFQIQTRIIIPDFDLDYVINTDQTGCQYQSTYNRSLAEQGAKTVLVKKKDLNKISHSFTAQYALTASGKILPFVFLCMQEPSGRFGPIVKKKVDALTDKFKNVIVACTKSGKFTKQLYEEFLKSFILPYVKQKKFLFIIDSWGGQTDQLLYDHVFVDERKACTCTIKVIPPKCTPICQPCDVYFYRQVKIFTKKIQNAPDLLKNNREIASREDSIQIHSLILHQLSAPAFSPMIKYAWFAAKLTNNEEKPLFLNVNEVCFPITLLKNPCACKAVGFIKCAWCSAVLCFGCFYDKYHPKFCSSVTSDDSDSE